MIVELGHFALVSALMVTILQTVLPLIGAQMHIGSLLRFAPAAAQAQALLVLVAYACLSYAFVTDDFSVRYVAANSNSALPLYYKLSAVWGAHEGSLLLWILILAAWTLAVTIFNTDLPAQFSARVIAVMGFISAGFLLFTIITSNPFDRVFPIPFDGRDLNPLLQDFGLIIHPPLLYIGYVGFSVAFAFAVASLISGRLDMLWARRSRPWTLMAWTFLTAGIALGSWWAYHELGWGGWWFWDPVENASFMPWLVGTALIHSLIIAEKRNAFKSWAVLLALLTFSLSLLGTFLVRSGVLISVHAFASDPARGVFILLFLGIVTGISLILYAWRAPMIHSQNRFGIFSRESFLLINNVILLTSALSILIATLYPLFMEVLDLGKISVGPPYFNTVFVPLTLPLVFLAGLGPFLQWQQATTERISRMIRGILPVALAIGILVPLLGYGQWSLIATVGITAGSWVILVSLVHLIRRMTAAQSLTGGFIGMTFAHIGIGVFTLGVTLTSVYSVEREVLMEEGVQVTVRGYDFIFKGVETVEDANYSAEQAMIEVLKDGNQIAVLHPQKRVYQVQTNPMTEVAIDIHFLRDLYVALGEKVPNGMWGMRVYYRPMVRWIWLGALLMAIGGISAAFDRRYRLRARRRELIRAALAK